jgi:hypothetical protein
VDETEKDKRFRFTDLLIILICLSGATVSLYLFRIDLFQIIQPQNNKSVGTITYNDNTDRWQLGNRVLWKNNAVQRQQENRVLWERLLDDSPVYSGDLIRVADFSEAVLHVENGQITLGENTQIRIHIKKGLPEIEYFSGTLTVDSDLENEIVVTVNGKRMTALHSVEGDTGKVFRIIEGIDPESTAPAVSVTRPQPGKRYLKTGPQPPDIVFAWNSFNIELGEALRLEVAENWNFTRIAWETTAFDTAVLPCDTGVWYWRLSYRGISLASGRITVTDASGPVLFRPVAKSVLRYQGEQPDTYFRWSEVTGASYYLLEAGEMQDFVNPQIKRQVYGTSFVDSSLRQGTWFWRVCPVFSPDYEGSAGSSSVASFSIERKDSLEVPPLIPPPESTIVRPSAVTEEEPVLRPIFPPDNYTIATELLPDINFTWASNLRFQKRFQVSARSDFLQVEIDEQVSGNSFHGCSLPSGDWYWRVITANAVARQEFSATPARHFSLISTLPAPVLELPRHGSQVRTNANRPAVFSWRPVTGAEAYHFKLYTVANQNDPVYERNFTKDIRQTVLTDTLAEGDYHWTVQAVALESAVGTRQTGSLGTGRFTLRKRFSLVLESPTDGTVLPGLTALRQTTVFRWSTREEVGRSRFILSKNSDPLQGLPEVQIPNPGRTVRLDRLGEGIWYWTVEAWTADGFRIDAGTPRQLRVMPIPTLPEAGNRHPSRGHRIGANELRELWAQGGLVFSWSAVDGANAYIFTLFQEENNRRRQIIRTDPLNQTRWTLNDIALLDEGTFVWQVEAVNHRNGTIEQRGRIGENAFYVDVPVPQVEAGEGEIFDDD